MFQSIPIKWRVNTDDHIRKSAKVQFSRLLRSGCWSCYRKVDHHLDKEVAGEACADQGEEIVDCEKLSESG